MRTIGTGNSAQPTSGFGPDAITAVKVEVTNASDVLVDLSAYAVSLEYDSSADEIVDAATVVFRRLEGASSLAPLMTASPPVDLGRRIVVSINPGSGTYVEVFRGKITDVDWPERFGDVTVQCLDQARDASRTWIEDAIEYGSTTGVSLETVMQAVANDNMASPPTLYFPAATSAVVQHVAGDPPYGPTEQSVLDAERALAESYGGTIRWRYIDSLSAWRWTVFTPSRTKTVPDHTFGTSDYFDVKQIKQSDADIRNVIEVEYIGEGGAKESVTVQDSVSTGGAMTAASATLTVTGGNTFAAADVGKAIKVPGAAAAGATLTTTIATYVSATSVTLAVAASTTVSGKEVLWGSIATYGRLYAKISEGSDSPVNNATLATALANAALSDLKEPDVLLEIACRYFWPGEIGVDLYRFTANSVHFSSDQDLAPMQFRHRIAVGESPTTHIMVRGKPSGGVLSWRRRTSTSAVSSSIADVPTLQITGFREVARTATTATLGWNVSGSVHEIWGFSTTVAQPISTDPWPSLTGVPTFRLTAATTEYTVNIPATGYVTYVRIVPISATAERGTFWDLTVQPNTPSQLLQRARAFSTSATQVVVRVAVADPHPSDAVDVSVAYTATGCTVTETSPQTILAAAITSDIDTTGTKDFTVTRPAFGAGTGRVAFTASASGRLSDVDAVDIPAVDRDFTTAQISTAEIAALAVTAAKIGAAAVEEGKIAAGAVTTDKIGALAVTTAKIAALAVTSAEIGAAAVTTAKIANLAVTDAILAAGAVTTTKITDTAVTSAKIAANTIVAGNIAAGTITTTEIAANTITAGDIAAGTITATEIAASTITGAKIAATTITAANIAALTITAAEIAAATITGAKIAAATVAAGNIVAGTITANEIAANTITAAKIAALTITAAELAAGSVTAAKISVTNLAAINADLGTVTSGYIQNSGNTAAIRLSGTTTLPTTNYLDFTATGAGLFLKNAGLEITADGKVTAKVVKLIGDGSTPTLGGIAALWDGTNSIGGTDTSGKVTLTTATGGTSSTGVQCIVTFATAYSAAPYVLLTTNDSTQEYVTSVSTTSFSINTVTQGYIAGQAVIFYYQVIG